MASTISNAKVLRPSSFTDGINSEKGIRSQTILPWDRFSNWLHSICVVTFDLELGQALEVRKVGALVTVIVITESVRVSTCKLTGQNLLFDVVLITSYQFPISFSTLILADVTSRAAEPGAEHQNLDL